MADQKDDNQKRGCGCCGEKRDHDDKKDHCENKCVSECEYGQQTMEFYSYIQSVENAAFALSNLPVGQARLGNLYVGPKSSIDYQLTDGTNTTFWTMSPTCDYETCIVNTQTLAYATVPASKGNFSPGNPYSVKVSPSSALTSPAPAVTFNDPDPLPAGQFLGTYQNNGNEYTLFSFNDSDLLNTNVLAFIAGTAPNSKQLTRLLPQAPIVEPVKYFGLRDLLLIVEYLVKKINELCLPELAKVSVIDRLVAALHKIHDDASRYYGNDDNDKLDAGFSFCKESRIPECGPIYIADDQVLLNFLSYAQFLLRSYFTNSCDCDLTFDHACKHVFGRLCVVTVSKRPFFQIGG